MGTENSCMRPNTIEIPRIIHFIWAGGTKLMPPNSIKTVLKWAQANIQDDFSIYLWVDLKTYTGDMTQLTKTYVELFKNQAIKLNFEYEINFDEDSKFKILDIEQEGVSNELVRYEIEKPLPNYGASSDILRYQILWQYGGCYFDSDVPPSIDTKLSEYELFAEAQSNHVLGYSASSQGRTNTFGNDAFICSQNNPILKQILKKIEQKYSADFIKRIEFSISEAYASTLPDCIRQTTIERTGPGLIRQSLEGNLKHTYKIDKLLHIEPGANTHHWLGVPLRKCNNREEILDAIKMSINFELKYFSVLKLDDHVMHLKKMMTESEVEDIDNEKAFEYVLGFANSILAFKKASVIQLTLTNQLTVDFFRKNKNSFPKTFVLPDNLHHHFRQVFSPTIDYDRLDTPNLNELCKISQKLYSFCANTIIFVEENLYISDVTAKSNIKQNLAEINRVIPHYCKNLSVLNVNEASILIQRLEESAIKLEELITLCSENILSNSAEEKEEEKSNSPRMKM